MAFEKDRHEFDDRGFMVEKDTKEVANQKERWLNKHKDHGSEYPKWVKPHKDHVIEVNGNKVTPHHESFVDRETNDVHVLVNDAAEEEKALRGSEQKEEHGVSRRKK